MTSTPEQLAPSALRPMGNLVVTAGVDDGDSPRDVMDLFALDAFVAGREPFARSVYLQDVAAEADFLPVGSRLLRESVDEDSAAHLAVGEGWTLRSTHWRRAGKAAVRVTATSAELAEAVLARATDGAVEVPVDLPDRVSIGFWHRAGHGPTRVHREIETPRWDDIRENYTAQVAGAVDGLMDLRPQDVSGRLLLLHGPPGTGKTTLLRALAERWRDWCQVDCVLDPERLFADPGYLLEVALGAEDGTERWRLLLLEDCDELIRSEAKASTGQGLSRLLNLTDGLLGQGRNVIVAVTTNENLARLHPAVVRPGRSLARLEVGPLGPHEARRWLAEAGCVWGGGGSGGGVSGGGVSGGGVSIPEHLDRDGATLADLYALRSAARLLDVVAPPVAIGGYL